jgi:hypothetical protein
MHLDLHQAVALASLAPPAFHIEREPSRAIAPHLGLGQLGKQLPDRSEESGVRRRIGPRCPSDRALVDVDDLVDQIESFDPGVAAGEDFCTVEVPGQSLVQNVRHQSGLAGPRHPCHRHEEPQRNVDREVLEVVGPRPDHPEPLVGRRLPPPWRHWDP